MSALTRRRPDGRRHRRRPARHRAGPRRTSRSWSTTPSSKGATVLCGGDAADGPGWFYPPTVRRRHHAGHADVPRGGVRAGRRRCTGSPDIDEAHRARQRHRRSASAPTPGPPTRTSRTRFVADLDAGAVFINGMTTSYPELPFGGDEAIRLRPRAVRARHPRVLQPQDRLGRPAHPPRAEATRRRRRSDAGTGTPAGDVGLGMELTCPKCHGTDARLRAQRCARSTSAPSAGASSWTAASWSG